MAKSLQHALELVAFCAIPTLVGAGIVWWQIGPDIGGWARGLLPRLIPIGVLSSIGALGFIAFIFTHYSDAREIGPDANSIRDTLGGDVFIIALVLVISLIFDGWPGEIVKTMGILVTVFAGGGVGAVVLFLGMSFCEVVYQLRK